MIEQIRIPEFDPAIPSHARMAELSKSAHESVLGSQGIDPSMKLRLRSTNAQPRHRGIGR